MILEHTSFIYSLYKDVTIRLPKLYRVSPM